MASYVSIIIKDSDLSVAQLNAELGLSAGKAITDITADVITSAGHGLSNGQIVYVQGTTVPTGASASVGYYVIEADTDTVQLSLTAGGAAITISGGAAAVLIPLEDKARLINAAVNYLMGAAMGNVAAGVVSVTTRTTDPAPALVGTNSRQNVVKVG